jgi:hypothetical protein
MTAAAKLKIGKLKIKKESRSVGAFSIFNFQFSIPTTEVLR